MKNEGFVPFDNYVECKNRQDIYMRTNMSKFDSERVLDKELIKNLSEDKISDLAIIGDTRIVVSESKLKLCLTNHAYNP